MLSSLALALLLVSSTAQLSSAQKPENHYPPQPQLDRQLQQDYKLPFSITWDIAIGNGGTDRQPTQQEYEWVVEATENWFTENTEREYDSVDGLDPQGVDCTLQSDQTLWDSTATYPHRIYMVCETTFQATSVTLVPSAVDYLVTLNENYPVREFIINYLLTTGDDSLFHFSQRVAYLTNSDINTSPGGGGTPANTPTPANNPQPTPSPQTPPSFSSSWWLPARLEFNVAVNSIVQDRQPTQAEYEGFQVAVQQWLKDSLRNAYSNENDFYVSDVLSSISSSDWDSTDNLPHQIVFNAYVVYNADNKADIPSLEEFFATMRTDSVDFTTFLTDYLRYAEPNDSHFRSVTSGLYSSQQNGPIISAGSTPNPAAPPSTPTPTPPPVRSTPAPVNPNVDIIVTVPTESNWTYTIGDFGVTDRQPTQAEYEGLVDATHEWLTRIFREYYNENNPSQNFPQFVGIKTELVQGIYRPGSDPGMDNAAPHLVILKYDITFALDENDDTQVTPHMDDIFGVIEQADLDQYVLLYVHGSEPSDSVFRGTNSANWVYSAEDYEYVPRPTRSPSTMVTEGEPGFTGVDRADFEKAKYIPVSLQYKLRLVEADAHGAPTPEEWEGLSEAIRNFWIETFSTQYASNADADFVIVDAKWDVDTTDYDATQDFPYVGRHLTHVLFTEASTGLPGTIAFRQQMSNAIPNSNLIPTYIQNSMPVDSLFRDTIEIQWEY